MLGYFIGNVRRPALIITIIYLLLGGLWILFSDKLLLIIFDDLQTLTRAQTYKGWIFIAGSGLLIYVLLSRTLRKLHLKEQSLRLTELLHQEFFDQHFEPIWKTDREGNAIFSNQKWKEFTGEPVPGKRPFAWLDRVHPDDKQLALEQFINGFLARENFRAEYRLRNKAGNYTWVLNTCIPYNDTSGNFAGFTGFVFDIEEKKLLQEKYKESSRKYGYLFSNNPNPMFVYDIQDMRILEANMAAWELYGYAEKEFLSLAISDLRAYSDAYVLDEQMENTTKAGRQNNNKIHKRKDGSTFDVEITGQSLPLQSGRQMRLVIVRDVSEQIKAFRSAYEGDIRFRAIFRNSPQGGFICNDDFLITDANPAAGKILEIDPAKIKGMRLKDFLASDTDLDIFGQIESKPLVGEAYFMRFTGAEIRASFNAIRFVENEKYKIYFTFSDIDASHKIQIALQESERINSTLVSNLPGMAYRSRFDQNYTMTFVSFGVEKLTGYQAPQILHNNQVSYGELIHPDDRSRVRKKISEAIEAKTRYDIQYRIICREGDIKWVWEQAMGIYHSNNKLSFVEGFIMDITREKEAQDQVEFQSKFLGMIIDNIPFPLFYKNTAGVYGGCNIAFCEFLGRPKDQIIGKTVFDIFSKEQANVFYQKDTSLINTGENQVYETEISFPDGRKMDAVFHKSVFYDLDNTTLGIIGIYFDITQRVQAERVIKQQLEELARINSELERFSYTVSHDLRSPLVTIKGFLGLLREDIQEQNTLQMQEDIMRIENAADKMQQLLEDLLRLSRIGKVLENNEQFSMSNPAIEAHELLFGLFKGKNCNVIIQDDMPVVVGVKARLRELFQNLLENAVKFSLSNQSPTIKVYARSNNGLDVFCVEDNGIGIDPSYHEKVFGLFNKLDTSTPGTGLGLSLVKRIIENHKGSIWIESEGDNKGTTFCFTLNTENS